MKSLQLVPIDDLVPAAYNPRLADANRLYMLKMSLQKLGFLLPIYCDPFNNILSGHQRHLVAKELGYTHVPVQYTDKAMVPDEIKALNLLFNRSTNDMEQGDTPTGLTSDLMKSRYSELINTLPDVGIKYPCMKPSRVKVDRIWRANAYRKSSYSLGIARILRKRYNVTMPIIVNRKNKKLVNGIGRLAVVMERKERFIDVIYLNDPLECEFAQLAMNLITMDFNIHEVPEYRDYLRYNSYRRSDQFKMEDGDRPIRPAMRWKVKRRAGHGEPWFDIESDLWRDKWLRCYGRSIVNFGSGKGTDTLRMRRIGCRVADFEPYLTGKRDTIVLPDESREHNRKFLEDIASMPEFTSIFCIAVFNSIPFQEDREKVLTILTSLAGPRTRVYISVPSLKDRMTRSRASLGQRSLYTELDYETNTDIAGLGSDPKVQHYYRRKEFYDLMKTHFGVVNTERMNTLWLATAINPCPVDPIKLREALEFEFNLPFRDGTRLNLVDEALDAFNTRLKIKL